MDVRVEVAALFFGAAFFVLAFFLVRAVGARRGASTRSKILPAMTGSTPGGSSPFVGYVSPEARSTARAARAHVATWIVVTPIAALVIIGLVIAVVAILRGREAAQRRNVAVRAALVVERSKELARSTPDVVPSSLARLRPDASYFVLSRSGDPYGHGLLMRRCAAEAAPEEMLAACAGATHVVVVRDRDVFVFDLESKHLRGGVVLERGGEHDPDAVVSLLIDEIGGQPLR